MKKNIHVVIMAGGSGTRFWPYSRDAKPKQFLDVLGTGRSLLQMTYDRFLDITGKDKIWIVSNEKYDSIIHEQLPEVSSDQILLEPEKRNTAPCIAYSAYKILKKDPQAAMIVTPSDHLIFGENQFKNVVDAAITDATTKDHLVTIGIRPTRPETGYGYIQYLSDPQSKIKRVKTFTEKPQLELATKFLESGDFLWNSGIFIWSVEAIVSAFEKHESEIANLFGAGLGDYYTNNEAAFIKKTYSHCKSISIDYAIMEKAENVYVVPAEFSWSDLGSWNTLHEIKEKDDNQNVVSGSVLSYDSKNNYFHAIKGKPIIAQGLEGFLVADFEDILLICKKDKGERIKDFLADVRTQKGDKHL